MAAMKTPGVYIVEKNAFPNSIVEVASAVPAFVGYTEKAENEGKSLRNRPWRITSMAEFDKYFGGSPTEKIVRFRLVGAPAANQPTGPAAGGGAAAAPPQPLAARDAERFAFDQSDYLLQQSQGFYLLYYGMRLFFQNGGGPCYVVSVGEYADGAGVQVNAAALGAGLAALATEPEPTMVVIPEAVLLAETDCDRLQMAMLAHCGQTMKNRVAILDIREGYQDRSVQPDCVAAFRDAIGINHLSFGAAYYPWLHTTVLQERDLSHANIDAASRPVLIDGIKAELLARGVTGARLAQQNLEVEKIRTATTAGDVTQLAMTLLGISPLYKAIMGEMARRLNLLPPGAAMAGIYTMVDNTRGVWTAPANVSVNSVVAPAVAISDPQQQDLNVTPQGKSINAIRSFIGAGSLVWGARTLDGNSLDWRYINVRRTMIMLEESIRLAARAMVFEPNVASTWVTMKSMIVNFLAGIWKRGGLAGAVPDDAFSVQVGLGQTMTPEDLLQGILRVTVRVAVSRPAEFLQITFQQQMQDIPGQQA
jgi:hypothetical protein